MQRLFPLLVVSEQTRLAAQLPEPLGLLGHGLCHDVAIAFLLGHRSAQSCGDLDRVTEHAPHQRFDRIELLLDNGHRSFPGYLFDAALVSGDGWHKRSLLTGFERRSLAGSFWGRDGAVLRHDVGPPNAAIAFVVLSPVLIFAVNRAGQIAGTFLVNLLTF
ncbi:hypothetical protein D3C80_1073280 [compost metagenome]